MVDLRLVPQHASIAPEVVIPDDTACGEIAKPVLHGDDELRFGCQTVERTGASMTAEVSR